jgi:hypothetical protein
MKGRAGTRDYEGENPMMPGRKKLGGAALKF